MARCAARERERQMGSGLRVRDLRRRSASWARSRCRRSSGARSRTPSSATGWTRPWPGKGLAPEATVAVLRFAFEELGLHRVEVAIVPRNHASRRVVEKLDLREEGVALRYLEIDGRWEDHVRYAITAEEWAVARGELARRWLERASWRVPPAAGAAGCSGLPRAVHDGGGVAEELLDVLLVGVGGRRLPHAAAQTHGADEAVDGSRPRCSGR